MARMPFLKFYPNDWLADPCVRSCGVAARGLWLDMLSLMHLCARRGYLLAASGSPLSPEQLARLTGCSAEEVTRLLAELRSSGVFSCTDDGIIYSRRMVRDEGKREKCVEAGRRGGLRSAESRTLEGQAHTLKGEVKGSVKGGIKGGLKLPEARGQTPEEEPPKPPAKKLRPRNPSFDAVALACGVDPATAASLIGKVSAALASADPPYSPDDVTAFAARFWEFCPWAAQDGRTRPTPNELQNHIGKLRAAPAPMQVKPAPRGAGGLFDHAAKTEARILSQIGEALNPKPE